MKNLVKSKQLPKNHVFLRVRDYEGKVIGAIKHPYDGTFEGMQKSAERLSSELNWMDNASGINSQIGATDSEGQFKWIISPNCRHIAEIGTREARYILGDISARI